MRKNNYIKSIVLASGLLLLISNLANAQKVDSTTTSTTTTTTPSTTATTTTTTTTTSTPFKPSGKLWGQVFADAIYKGHGDSLGRGFGQYANGGLLPSAGNFPQSINGFQFRRVYIGYNYDISPKYAAEVLLSAENNIAGQDVLGDNKLAPFIKYADIRIKSVYPGADLVVGQQATPAFAKSSEPIWGYRSIEKTITDFHGTPSYDMGVALQGIFDFKTNDIKTGNYGYNVMIANGTSAKQMPTTSFKWIYSDIWGYFMNKKIFVDVYFDYNMLHRIPSTATASAINQSRSMVKLTVGYISPKFTIGAEGFINTFANQFTATETVGAKKDTLSPAAEGISFFVRGTICPKWGFFARYDMVNPNNKIDSTKFSSYASLAGTNVGSYTSATFSKETFITAGLDFAADKNLHIMPNIWYNGFDSQTKLAGPGATKGKDYDLVYRVTFAYTFGK